MRLSPVFPVTVATAAGLLAAALAGTVPARADGPHPPSPAPGASGQYHEVFFPDGHPRMIKGRGEHPTPVDHMRAPQGVATLQKTGPDANRFVIVIVGDGYTKKQQPAYEKNAKALMNTLFKVPPYKQYRKLFNIYRVNIVSSVSGVSGDPKKGTRKKTPLGMHYYCDGIQRLLCTDENAANRYAARASSAINEVVTIANSKTYGGSGGPLTSVAGGNASAGQILPHEMGHTTGKLGDEYDYPYAKASGGPEPGFANVSKSGGGGLKKGKRKWYRWLGAGSPSGGKVGAYQGANYYKKGFYRPTKDSLMKTLGKAFNPPSREAMITGFWRDVNPIDSAKPNRSPVGRTDSLWVKTVPTRVRVAWWVDKKYIKSTVGKKTLSLKGFKLKAGKKHWVTATVKDPTGWVRDEADRAKYMSQRVTWTVRP